MIRERSNTNVYSLTINTGRITAMDVPSATPDKLRGLAEPDGENAGAGRSPVSPPAWSATGGRSASSDSG